MCASGQEKLFPITTKILCTILNGKWMFDTELICKSSPHGETNGFSTTWSDAWMHNYKAKIN